MCTGSQCTGAATEDSNVNNFTSTPDFSVAATLKGISTFKHSDTVKTDHSIASVDTFCTVFFAHDQGAFSLANKQVQ